MSRPNPEYRSPVTVTREELQECQQLGLTQEQTATRLNLAQARYVGRRERELGIPRPTREFHARLEGEVRERANALLADGQPAPWVSETVNAAGDRIRELAQMRPDHDAHILQWRQVWGQIRRNPVLLDLHRQFAPKGPKGRPA